jgi:hypothetical protein
MYCHTVKLVGECHARLYLESSSGFGVAENGGRGGVAA